MGLSKKEIIQAVWNKIKGILGTNDISGIGDGTVTGAIDSLNSKLIICEYNISGLSVNANSSATQSITIDTIDGYVPSSVAFERNDNASWHIITSFCIINNEVIMTAISNATSTNVLTGKIRVTYTKS